MTSPDLPAPVDVVLPCLDEAAALPGVLASLPPGWRAIVVDNGSVDDSAAVARRCGADVVREPRRGFGAACTAGLLAATAPVVAFCDADGSLDLAELPRVVGLLRHPGARRPDPAGPDDVGSRHAGLDHGGPDHGRPDHGGSDPAGPDHVGPGRDRDGGGPVLVLGRRRPTTAGAWPVHARLANRVLARQVRRATGAPVTDLGPMRAAPREALLALGLRDLRFGYPLEMVLRAAATGWRILEVDVTYRPRIGRSKVTGTVRGTMAAITDMRRLLAEPGTPA